MMMMAVVVVMVVVIVGMAGVVAVEVAIVMRLTIVTPGDRDNGQ
jgi:hypothetical protein